VSYLNTAPLVWGFQYGPNQGLFDLEFRLPSECADRLAAGAADIGIAPSIELARQGLELIPGAGIACRGAVRSILLVTRTPLAEIRTLAGDTSSRTSVALARIILERRYGALPRVIARPPDLPSMLAEADAALLIGDPALHVEPERLPYQTLDLGAEWRDMTGLPMVFAVWARRPGAAANDPAALAEAFLASCRFGRARLEEIARRESAPRGFTEAFAHEYLSRHIVNELGEEEYAGMRRFLAYARESGMLEAPGGAPA
jgi:chorismate dehydratase